MDRLYEHERRAKALELRSQRVYGFGNRGFSQDSFLDVFNLQILPCEYAGSFLDSSYISAGWRGRNIVDAPFAIGICVDARGRTDCVVSRREVRNVHPLGIVLSCER